MEINSHLVYLSLGYRQNKNHILCRESGFSDLMDIIFEPSHEKTNNVVSDQVRHKSGCTVTEDR